MNDSKLLAETFIEMGVMVDSLRAEVESADFARNHAESENKTAQELATKYRNEVFALQKIIDDWKAKYEALNKELLVTKEKLTKARKRKKL